MQVDLKRGQVTASIEEIALYNMLLTEAIFDLLAEKGVLTSEEVKARIEKLKNETKVNLTRIQ
jgi:hypothetical protein